MNPVEKGKLKSHSLFVFSSQQLRNRNQFCYLPPSGGKLREPNCRMAWAVLTIPFVLQIFLYLEYSTEIQFIQSSSTLSTLTKKKLPPRSTSCWSGIHIFNSSFFLLLSTCAALQMKLTIWLVLSTRLDLDLFNIRRILYNSRDMADIWMTLDWTCHSAVYARMLSRVNWPDQTETMQYLICKFTV